MSAKGATAAGIGAALGAAAGPPSGGSKLDVGVLVYHTVIVLLALVALVVILRIPRAFARLWRASEWTRGHLLGYQPYAGPPQVPYVGPGPTLDYSNLKGVGTSQDSHIYETKFAVFARESTGAYPPHIEPTPLFLRPVVSLLRSRVAPGFSATQIAVCAGWLAVMLYPAIYRSAGPFTDFDRYGYIAVSQIPFVVAFATKNNILGMFLGMGYEKVNRTYPRWRGLNSPPSQLNFLHRFVARLAIISANVHGLGYSQFLSFRCLGFDKCIYQYINGVSAMYSWRKSSYRKTISDSSCSSLSTAFCYLPPLLSGKTRTIFSFILTSSLSKSSSSL